MPPEPAERVSRLRAGESVDRDLRALLELPDRNRRPGSGDAVDRALVEPVRAQSDLQRRNRGVADDAARRRRNDERSDDDQQKSAPLCGA